LPVLRLEAEARGKLEAARPELRDDGAGLAEERICNGGPESVRRIARVRIRPAGRVLHVVDYVLLVVGMIEQVECFSSNAQLASLSEAEVSSHTEIEIFERGTEERIEFLSGHNREIQFRTVEDCGVGSTAGPRSGCR